MRVISLSALLIFAASALADDYDEAAARAVRERKPLVTFVGAFIRPISPVAVTSHVDTGKLPGYPPACVVVSVPGGDWLHWRATLPAGASDATILRAAGIKAVQPVAVPFSVRSAADDDLPGRGAWPDGLDFPSGMTRYRSAKFTQDIAVQTDQFGVDRDRINRFPRLALLRKWRVNGGMENVQEGSFRSDLYRSEHKPKTWVGDIEVKNGTNVLVNYGRGWVNSGVEATQKNRGIKRSYPDGTRFMDVLSTDRGVFEIRERRKLEGRWKYIVHQEYPANRPQGYAGSPAISDCRGCHQESGSGGYATGLVPGGDETLSDPLAGLE